MDRGSGACAEGVGKLGGKDSFEMLFCRARSGGFNPLPAKAVLPLSASRTGGEKLGFCSDFGAVAICWGIQGERNFRISATPALWLFTGAYRGREIFGIQRLFVAFVFIFLYF